MTDKPPFIEYVDHATMRRLLIENDLIAEVINCNCEECAESPEVQQIKREYAERKDTAIQPDS